MEFFHTIKAANKYTVRLVVRDYRILRTWANEVHHTLQLRCQTYCRYQRNVGLPRVLAQLILLSLEVLISKNGRLK